jgi:hypothetical protein
VRFSKLNFKTKANFITKVGEAMVPGIILVFVSLFVCLWPQTANAQIKGYAVQIAALRSQQSADELTKGLLARGIHAYWVQGASLGMVPEYGQFYRVRIGNFPTIESAYGYAEQLLDSGLLDAYAIAAYEPPMAAAQGDIALSGPPSKVQTFSPRRQIGSEAIDMVASIGTRGWLLLSSRSVLSTPAPNNSALSRELARLAASVGSRGWSLNNNITKLLARPAPALPPANSARPVDLAATDLSNLSGPKITALGARSIPYSPAPLSVPAPPRASSNNAGAPEISRSPLSPTIKSGAVTSARNTAYASPPRLQGMIEMRDGRMWMRLRNTDSDRSFSGMARITLSNDKNQQDVTPLQFTLPPDKEESFPVDEAMVKDGNWILMVYDENGAARMVRGASLAPAQAVQNPADQNANNQSQPAQGPPAYVTGYYDATATGAGGWTLSQNAATPNATGAAGQPQNNGLVPVSDLPGQSAADSQNNDGDQNATPPAAQVAPGQVTVIPRQIAVTSENLTMEFDISAPAPLNYIVVTVRAGEYQDTRQALMSTPVGRVPFLIPINNTSAGFSYEIKDEAQRVLASGNGDFRSLSRGN